MSFPMLRALFLKDLRLFFANRFFALVTGLGLVAYVTLYALMPQDVVEQVRLGMSGFEFSTQLRTELAEEGIELQPFPEVTLLRDAVAAGDVDAGFVLPEQALSTLAAGDRVSAQLLINAALPDEFADMYAMLLNELFNLQTGNQLPLSVTQEVLGVDMAGTPVSPQQRLQPMLAVLVLMVECLGLASLITAEIENGTMRAMLMTRLTVPGLFLAKGLFGTLLAFVQALLITSLTGGFGQHPSLVLATLLAGSFLVTGVAFLVGAVGRDFMSVLGWGMLALILLALPMINLIMPGLLTTWVDWIPSSHLVSILYRSAVFGEGWPQLIGSFLALTASALACFVIGAAVLTRRFR